MKKVVGLLVLVGIIIAGIYGLRSLGSFDPVKQGKDTMAKIGPGMSWKKVVDIAREPQEFYIISLDTRKVDGKTVETLKRGPSVRFNKDAVAKRISDNAMPHGFTFTYRYSSSLEYDVDFDNTGTVTSVDKSPIGALLNPD
jgi:hypothetical protein